MNYHYRYSFGVIAHQIKVLLKDHERGMLDREQTVARLHLLADKIGERKEVYEQLSLDDVRTHVQQHLKGNRR